MTKVVKEGAGEDEDDPGIFFRYHMVPPGKSHYFYSFGGENGKADIAKN